MMVSGCGVSTTHEIVNGFPPTCGAAEESSVSPGFIASSEAALAAGFAFPFFFFRPRGLSSSVG
jgi:hypothetical protein